MPTDCKTCSVCEAVLGKEMFATKRNQCRDCDNSTESLQRLMRTKWASQYKTKYKELRKDIPKWNRIVMAHRTSSRSSKGRSLTVEVEQLLSESTKAKVHRRIRPKKKMSWPCFQAHFSKAKHGGYSVPQLIERWDNLMATQTPCDQAGVQGGVTGYKRFRVELSDGSASESESAEVQKFTRGKRAKARMNEQDVQAIVDGPRTSLAVTCSCSHSHFQSLALALTVTCSCSPGTSLAVTCNLSAVTCSCSSPEHTVAELWCPRSKLMSQV